MIHSQWPADFLKDQQAFLANFEKTYGSSIKEKMRFFLEKIKSAIRRIFIRTAVMPSSMRHVGKRENAVEILTYDQLKLTGYEYSSHSKKWVIYFHGNSITAEEDMIAPWLSRAFKINVLSFNYRGTGNSEGSLKHLENDFCKDGVAAVQYLKQKYFLKNSDIILYGHSIGGVVSTKTAVYFPGCKIINDRSLANTNLVIPFTKKIVNKLGLEVDVLSSWKKIDENKKLIFYCSQDWVIRKKASLYRAYKIDKGEDKNSIQRIKLRKKNSNGFLRHGICFGNFDNSMQYYQQTYNFIHDVIILRSPHALEEWMKQ